MHVEIAPTGVTRVRAAPAKKPAADFRPFVVAGKGVRYTQMLEAIRPSFSEQM
jgi:hypothetical protein